MRAARPNRRPLRAAALAAAALCAALPLAAHASAATTTAGVATTVLAGQVAPSLSVASDLGQLDPALSETVVLTLMRPDLAGERALIAAQAEPTNAAYQTHLSPAAYAARFGVPAASYATALHYATAHGLTLQSVDDTHDSLLLKGSVAQLQDTFDVTMHSYSSGGRSWFSSTGGPRVPAAIGVIGVIGLQSERLAHVDTPKGTLHSIVPSQTTCMAGRCLGLTTPQDLWAAYDQPGNNLGAGASMAIFGEGQSDDVIADLRQFEAENKLRRIPVRVVHPEGDAGDYSDDAGAEEWNIDTQSSTGMSPEAKEEVLYFGTALTDASVLAVFNGWAHDATGPLQASASYGECEEAPGGAAANGQVTAGTAYTISSEQALTYAVGQGKTLFSSSGDTGGGCPVLPTSTNGAAAQGEPQPNYPGSSPNVVSVGGTVLYTTGATPNVRSIETAWLYTGGGTSFIFKKPAYQNPISAVTGICAGNPDGSTVTPNTPCRGVPDIAAQSGDIATNGYAITAAGANDQAGGGTSLASPLSMGMWTRLQAAKGGSGLGFANTTYYRYGANTTTAADGTTILVGGTDAKDFFDVGGTTQSQPGTSAPGTNQPYPTMARSAADPSGWDYVSGLGVPDITQLMKDAVGTTAPADPTLPPEAPVVPVGTVGSNCLPSGIITDPAGDATQLVVDPGVSEPAASQADLDLISGFVRYDKTNAALVFNTVVTNLGTTGGQYFRYVFTYGGTQYTAYAARSVAGALTYGLLSLGTGTAAQSTTISSTLTGSFGATPNTVTTIVPLSVINAAITTASPATAPIGVGTALTGQSQLGQRNTGAVTATADSSTGTCPFIVGGAATSAGPTPTLPESPLVPLLVLGGLGSAVVLTRRRRRTTTPAG